MKRGLSLRSMTRQKTEKAQLGHVKQLVTLQQGIPIEKSKDLVRVLKDSKIKANGSIQGDELRVSGKNRDDLQAAITLFREQQERLEIDLQFTNFRD